MGRTPSELLATVGSRELQTVLANDILTNREREEAAERARLEAEAAARRR